MAGRHETGGRSVMGKVTGPPVPLVGLGESRTRGKNSQLSPFTRSEDSRGPGLQFKGKTKSQPEVTRRNGGRSFSR